MAFGCINGNSNGQIKKDLEQLKRNLEERLAKLENPSSTVNTHVLSSPQN